MKITFTQHRELTGGRIVKPDDTLESPKDGTDALLQAYVDNGIAVGGLQPSTFIIQPDSSKEEAL